MSTGDARRGGRSAVLNDSVAPLDRSALTGGTRERPADLVSRSIAASGAAA
jgi:hypothetical protein